uniref:ANF_receptor domain-containing protein n=1 Tax=Macrostomum lignano TaxID=282301 RepID=A0A1I8FIN9_9PLAT
MTRQWSARGLRFVGPRCSSHGLVTLSVRFPIKRILRHTKDLHRISTRTSTGPPPDLHRTSTRTSTGPPPDSTGLSTGPPPDLTGLHRTSTGPHMGLCVTPLLLAILPLACPLAKELRIGLLLPSRASASGSYSNGVVQQIEAFNRSSDGTSVQILGLHSPMDYALRKRIKTQSFRLDVQAELPY